MKITNMQLFATYDMAKPDTEKVRGLNLAIRLTAVREANAVAKA
jgi:hypothetical protein